MSTSMPLRPYLLLLPISNEIIKSGLLTGSQSDLLFLMLPQGPAVECFFQTHPPVYSIVTIESERYSMKSKHRTITHALVKCYKPYISHGFLFPFPFYPKE